MSVSRIHTWSLDDATLDSGIVIANAGGGLPRRITPQKSNTSIYTDLGVTSLYRMNYEMTGGYGKRYLDSSGHGYHAPHGPYLTSAFAGGLTEVAGVGRQGDSTPAGRTVGVNGQNANFSGACWTGQRWVGLGSAGANIWGWSTPDGLSWSTASISVSTTPQSVTSDGNGTVIAGGSNWYYRSTDHGLTITSVSKAGPVFYGVGYDPVHGRWMMTTHQGQACYSDNGGASFSSYKTVAGGSTVLYVVAYGNGRWITGSSETVCYYSDNGGDNWTLFSMPGGVGTNYLTSIHYNSVLGMWAVGTYGRIWTSPDGTNWTLRNMGHTRTIRSIVHLNNGRFWYSGGYNTAGYSDDGVTWVQTNNYSVTSSDVWVATDGTNLMWFSGGAGANVAKIGNANGDWWDIISDSSGPMGPKEAANWDPATQSLTVTLWFKGDRYTNYERSFVANNRTLNAVGWWFWYDSSNRLNVQVVRAAGNVLSAYANYSQGLNDTLWHHVALTIPASGWSTSVVKFYIDGVLVPTYQATGTRGAFLGPVGGIRLPNSSNAIPYFDVQDLAIFVNKELTQAQIQSLMLNSFIGKSRFARTFDSAATIKGALLPGDSVSSISASQKSTRAYLSTDGINRTEVQPGAVLNYSVSAGQTLYLDVDHTHYMWQTLPFVADSLGGGPSIVYDEANHPDPDPVDGADGEVDLPPPEVEGNVESV